MSIIQGIVQSTHVTDYVNLTIYTTYTSYLTRTPQEEAESQLNRYCRYWVDEKFQKAMGKTTLVKLVLVFSGHRLVYRGEVRAGSKNFKRNLRRI